MIRPADTPSPIWRLCFVIAALLSLLALLDGSRTWAQQGPVPIDADQIQEIMNDQPEPEVASSATTLSGIDLLTLITRGGVFMIPIGVMSFMVVALASERLLMLRGQRIIPRRLVDDLRDLADPIDHFNPTAAFQSCQNRRSSAARVITAMLMRTGQPLADIERAAAETIDREADRHASPVRWLTLAAAATPLMGLLGTVWGMIVAFHESTTLTADRSRSEQLSEGIYTALVTTLAGLVVAIPAAILALYLENRLAKLFHRVEELAFDVAPGLERFKGRRRMDAEGTLHKIEGPKRPSNMPPSTSDVPPPPPRTSSKKRGGAKAG